MLIFYSLISRELLIFRTPIKNTIFWKSMTRLFRWIEINCFNISRFLTEVSTNLQKMHYFGQFKDHNLEKKKVNLTNDPIVFFCFLSSNCLWYSLLYLKIVKIHFHGVLFSSILVCKIPEFRRCKLWNQNFVSLDSRKIYIKESENPSFTFSFELRFKFVWSHGLLFFVPECYFV